MAYPSKYVKKPSIALVNPKPNNTTKWSDQQLAIFAFGEQVQQSGIFLAVAGSGKTTTLAELVARIIHARPTTRIAFAAFNKAIQLELESRLNFPGVTTKTFHAFGLAAWTKVAGKPQVDEKKLYKICERLKVPENLIQFVCKAVDLAKQQAFGVINSIDDMSEWFELVEHYEIKDSLSTEGAEQSDAGLDSLVQDGIICAIKCLRESIATDREIIDFGDMIYAPLIHNVSLEQYDIVMVDEAQDTNPSRRCLAKKMLKDGGVSFWVGDKFQAIYAFCGADANALDIIKEEFNCVEMPLTVSYRCPKAVVKLATQWVDHIQSAPNAPEGSVTEITFEQFLDLDQTSLRKQDVILCRNVKPLVEVAYSLIRKRIGCHVEGKDIGKGLMNLASRWNRAYSLPVLLEKITEYCEKETTRLKAKGHEGRAESLQDRCDTLAVIASSLPVGASVADLKQAIADLFDDTQAGTQAKTLTLSSIHKAKGREWDRVYLLGRKKFQPSKYARQDWQMTQEKNLIYVAVTRSKAEIIEVVYPSKTTKQGPQAV